MVNSRDASTSKEVSSRRDRTSAKTGTLAVAGTPATQRRQPNGNPSNSRDAVNNRNAGKNRDVSNSRDKINNRYSQKINGTSTSVTTESKAAAETPRTLQTATAAKTSAMQGMSADLVKPAISVTSTVSPFQSLNFVGLGLSGLRSYRPARLHSLAAWRSEPVRP